MNVPVTVDGHYGGSRVGGPVRVAGTRSTGSVAPSPGSPSHRRPLRCRRVTVTVTVTVAGEPEAMTQAMLRPAPPPCLRVRADAESGQAAAPSRPEPEGP